MQTSQSIDILFQDQHLLVVAKPAGIIVNQADSVTGPTIQDWFSEWLSQRSDQLTEAEWQALIPDDFDPQYGTPTEIFTQRAGIVHRLDKDTSGALVLARHPAALVRLLALFKQRQVQKKYVALTHGKFQVLEGVFTSPLGRASSDRKKFAVRPDGRSAETRYRVEQYWPHMDVAAVLSGKQSSVDKSSLSEFRKKASKIYQGFSLVTCWPKTGRTHQIRVHLAAAQHPIVGDITYLGRKRAKLDPLWCERQFLHAQSIEFTHPFTASKVVVDAPLSEDLSQAVGLLSESTSHHQN